MKGVKMTNAIQKPTKKAKAVAGKTTEATVTIHQQLDGNVYSRLVKYAKENGLMNVQTVIRLSSAQFLTSQGY